MVFRSHHVPQGIIILKKKEFLDLKKGYMTVSEYITCFMYLSCYALTMWKLIRRSMTIFSMVQTMVLPKL
jgi:hypothetical protein